MTTLQGGISSSSIVNDCVQAAADAYHFGSTPPDGYHLVGQVNNPSTGYQAVAYYNDATNTLIIASRGSETREFQQDWINNDGAMVSGNLPSQLDDAYDFAKSITDQYPDANTYFTGHSLGGSLSQMLAELDQFSDSNAITFNAYGTGNLTDKLNQKYGTSDNNGSNIDNYITPGDILSNSSPQVGDNHYLSPSNEELADYGLGLLGRNPFDLINGEIQAHNGILDPAQNYFNQANASNGPVHDPIIFDLNSDGIKTTTIDNGTYFNFDQNGFAEATAWADPNDGILVNDKNNDGIINDNSELVTNATLSAYDTNADGIINSNDAGFSQLQILKGDGTLESLSAAGIASINLSMINTNTTDVNGNTQLSLGSYTKTDGTTLSYGEYNLQANPTYSVATNWLPETPDVTALPDAQGYGTVYTLHQAMLRDSSGALENLVTSFVNATD